MPAPERILTSLICEVLEKNPRIGANELYKDVVPHYYKKKGTNLGRRHFFKYLGLMKENGLVEQRGSDKRGKPTELYLTEIGRSQYLQQSFELPNILGKSTISRDEALELKALYAIILYFSGGVRYKVYTEDAVKNILRSFGLSPSSLVVKSKKSIVKSDTEDVQQEIFQSPREGAIVYKEMFLRSDTHERGAKRYRLYLRGITSESVIDNRDLKAFKYLGFTSKDIMRAIRSLCSLNVLRPVGSLGLKITDETIYKVDKSIFDLMFGLRTLNGYDIFDKIESVMREIWFSFRPPTEEEKNWFYFIYGKEEASLLINDAHDSRVRITNGESMKSYFTRIIRSDKVKWSETNKRIDRINQDIIKIKNDMAWIRESYGATISKHQGLLNNIYETVYPKFFASLILDKPTNKKISHSISL